MHGKRVILPAVLVTLGFVMGACGNTPTTSPTSSLSQQTADDIATQAAGSLSGGSGGLMLELGAGAGSVPANASIRIHPGDPVSRTRNVLVDAGHVRTRPGEPSSISSASAESTWTVGQITYTATRTFYDAGGNQLAAYGPDATRLHLTLTADGSITTPQWTATIGRAGALDVTGIQTADDTLQFDGASNDTLQSHFTSYDGARQIYLYALGGRTLDAVRLLKDHSANPYPLSGKATWAWDVDRLRSDNKNDVAVHLTALVVVTFNGTANPDVVVDGTFHYKVNLNSGAITRV
jgi:hypothetical protein